MQNRRVRGHFMHDAIGYFGYFDVYQNGEWSGCGSIWMNPDGSVFEPGLLSEN